MKKNRNIITDQSSKPSNALGVVSHIYIIVIFTLFALYVGKGGYMNITVNKYSFFVVATVAYFSLLLLVGIGLFAMGKVKLREFNDYIVMTPVRWGILAYIALCVLSALFSKFGIAVWQGLGRFEGLSTILLYGGIFFAVSFFGRFSTLYIYLIGIVVIINAVISVLQFAGYNPLYLFPEGYTYHDAFVLYANQFLGTLGNSNLTAAFLCIAAPLFLAGYVLDIGKNSALLLIPWSCSIIILGISMVLAGIVGLCSMILITSPLFLNTKTGLERGLIAFGVGSISFGLVHSLEALYHLGTTRLSMNMNGISLVMIIGGVILICSTRLLGGIQESKMHPLLLRKIILSLESALIVAFIVFVYFIPLKSGFLYELNQIMHGMTSDSFGTSRIKIWKEVLKMIPEHLWLGGGPDTLAGRIDFAFTRTSELNGELIESAIDVAHNDYLNILVNTGLLSLLAYVAALSAALVRWLKVAPSNKAVAACGASATSYLSQIFFSFSICIVSPLFWILFGLMEAEANHSVKERM